MDAGDLSDRGQHLGRAVTGGVFALVLNCHMSKTMLLTKTCSPFDFLQRLRLGLSPNTGIKTVDSDLGVRGRGRPVALNEQVFVLSSIIAQMVRNHLHPRSLHPTRCSLNPSSLYRS